MASCTGRRESFRPCSGTHRRRSGPGSNGSWRWPIRAWRRAPSSLHDYASWSSSDGRGARASFDGELEALQQRTAGEIIARQDLGALTLAFGVAREEYEAPAEARAWRAGSSARLPWGLAGLSDSPQPVRVITRPEAPGFRLLDVGLRLLDPALSPHELPAGAPRPDTVLAVLGLAGPSGLAEADLFAQAYGFPFRREVHQGVLDVLMHRARARLGSLGRIERTPTGYVLRSTSTLIVHDPRSGPNDDDRVLRLVASRGALSAREASSSLGVSLRTAQSALDSLAEAGECVQVRRGKHFEYRVEDTTFQEPTGLRRLP